MSNNPSQLLLPQSTTTLSQTPPPSTSAMSVTRVHNKKDDTNNNNRLELYNSLFGESTKKRCDQTGLQLTQSLNYSLHTFLHLSDVYWVLAIIDVDSFDNIQDKYGQQNALRKIVQIGNVVKKFCENDPRKLKGFKLKGFELNDLFVDDENETKDEEEYCNHDHDLFAALMYCYPKLIKSEKYVSKLIKKNNSTNK